jgi:hypothetical protein
MALIINDQGLSKILFEALNKELTIAAEPVIKEALREIEIKMRERMAACLISYLEQSFSVERFGKDLRIIVKQ